MTTNIIEVLPKQIPLIWDAIKWAVIHADIGVQDRNRQSYLNELLHALLNRKAQCFVRMDGEKKLEALAITRVMNNPQTGDRFLYVQALYSFQFQTDDVWRRDFDFIKRFAKSQACKYIGCMSSNRRAFEIYEAIGLTEECRIYSVKL